MADIYVGTNNTATGTTGNDTFTADASGGLIVYGVHTLVGGAGDDNYYVTNGTKVVELANGGYDSILSSSSYVLPANVEQLSLWGTSDGYGNDLNNLILGSGYSNVLDGGKGHDSIFGQGGADVYQFGTQSGHDAIYGWNSASKIRIAGYSQFQSLSDVRAAMTQEGADVKITFSATDDVTIRNVNIADFTASNFQYALNMTGMKLSFDDEFDTFSSKTSDRDTGTWATWLGGGNENALDARTLRGNGERELYVDPDMKGTSGKALGLNPFSVDNGVLTITAAPTPEAVKSALYGYDYTSGYISSRDSFAQTYGYFEARMQLATGQGAWPAFWMFRTDNVWPPELDIMEAWNDSTAVQTVHTNQLGFHSQDHAQTYVPDGDTTMHTYGMLWTAEKLVWYLDGVEVFQTATPSDMHSPMYMVLNNAVSGGVGDPNFTSQLKIDYVRAYTVDEAPAAQHGYWGKVDGALDGFNAAYYGAHNPDVIKAGIDLFTHYQKYGKAEGRLAYDPTAGTETSSGTPTTGTTPVTTTPVTTTPVTTTPDTTTPVTTTPVTTTPTEHGYWGANVGMPGGFNALYYAAHNPDVVASGLDLLDHYLRYGKAEGRLAYDASDVATATHHADWSATSGQPDGFNALYYAAHNPDVVAAGLDLLDHYVRYGKAEGRLAHDVATEVAPVDTSPSAPTPVATPPIVTTPGDTAPVARTHAYWGVTAGQPDGFNAAYYAAHNPDVVAARLDLLTHYQQYGKAEGRLAYDATDIVTHAEWASVADKPDGFNAFYYAAHNPDVVASGLDLLDHYLRYGKAEGRLAFEPDTVTTASATSASTATAMITGTTLIGGTEAHAVSSSMMLMDDGDGVAVGGDVVIEPPHAGDGAITTASVAAYFDSLPVAAPTETVTVPTPTILAYEWAGTSVYYGEDSLHLLGVTTSEVQHAYAA